MAPHTQDSVQSPVAVPDTMAHCTLGSSMPLAVRLSLPIITLKGYGSVTLPSTGTRPSSAVMAWLPTRVAFYAPEGYRPDQWPSRPLAEHILYDQHRCAACLVASLTAPKVLAKAKLVALLLLLLPDSGQPLASMEMPSFDSTHFKLSDDNALLAPLSPLS